MNQKYSLENLKSLDFELWSELAKQDIETFEAMRLAAIEDFIASAPESRRQRLRCLQWRIDQERRRSHSPMGACIRISRMMWENLMGEDGLVEQIKYLREPAIVQTIKPEPRYQATVIPFHSKS